jgi:NADP-reducing hydrogenase subunit HndB
MKSLAELAAIRDKMKDKIVLREGSNGTRIVVGMATCGIAAGARPVLNAFVEGVDKEGLNGSVIVSRRDALAFASMNPLLRFTKPARKR